METLIFSGLVIALERAHKVTWGLSVLVKVFERFALTTDTHPATDTVHKPGNLWSCLSEKHKIPKETTSNEYSEFACEVQCCCYCNRRLLQVSKTVLTLLLKRCVPHFTEAVTPFT